MQVVKNIKVPTGNICVGQGEKGLLEFLSIGDYGMAKNIKAYFLGYNDEINSVLHGELLPLTEKWVVTISTQYGCSMGCKFCDVPKVGPGYNATTEDMVNQVIEALKIHPEVEATKRLNIHFARMGEPTWNPNVLECAKEIRKAIRPYIGRSLVHPVVSTMMPRHNHKLFHFLNEWMEIKNDLFKGDAGLQFSINSTSDDERREMFSGNSFTLEAIALMGEALPQPKGRKVALNFALAGYEVDAVKLRGMFDPKKFMCKITPMHLTHSCVENHIETEDGYTNFYPYKKVEEDLKRAGFDVIVFIPSLEEDQGRITCGNAILSGTTPYGKGIVMQ